MVLIFISLLLLLHFIAGPLAVVSMNTRPFSEPLARLNIYSPVSALAPAPENHSNLAVYPDHSNDNFFGLSDLHFRENQRDLGRKVETFRPEVPNHLSHPQHQATNLQNSYHSVVFNPFVSTPPSYQTDLSRPQIHVHESFSGLAALNSYSATPTSNVSPSPSSMTSNYHKRSLHSQEEASRIDRSGTTTNAQRRRMGRFAASTNNDIDSTLTGLKDPSEYYSRLGPIMNHLSSKILLNGGVQADNGPSAGSEVPTETGMVGQQLIWFSHYFSSFDFTLIQMAQSGLVWENIAASLHLPELQIYLRYVFLVQIGQLPHHLIRLDLTWSPEEQHGLYQLYNAYPFTVQTQALLSAGSGVWTNIRTRFPFRGISEIRIQLLNLILVSLFPIAEFKADLIQLPRLASYCTMNANMPAEHALHDRTMLATACQIVSEGIRV